MTTYAEVVDGIAANPVPGDPKDYFPEEWLAKNPPFQIVPDGTQHGAKDDGAGGWNNPDGSHVAKDGTFTPAQKPQPKPATTKQQILDQIAILTGLANQLP